MKSKYIIKTFVIILSLFAASTSYAQVLENPCASSLSSKKAVFSVKYFLSHSNDSDPITETGATNETVDQIQLVTNEFECTKLMAIVNGSEKYRTINNSIDPTRTLYFYKTQNLYYFFWSKKPEYDDRPFMGPKTLFVVVRKDFNQVWEYYF